MCRLKDSTNQPHEAYDSRSSYTLPGSALALINEGSEYILDDQNI